MMDATTANTAPFSAHAATAWTQYPALLPYAFAKTHQVLAWRAAGELHVAHTAATPRSALGELARLHGTYREQVLTDDAWQAALQAVYGQASQGSAQSAADAAGDATSAVPPSTHAPTIVLATQRLIECFITTSWY